MHSRICLDGAFAENPVIPALSATALYGRGVFTTVSISGGEPFLWDKHWRRLNANAVAVGMDVAGVVEPDVYSWLGKLIDENHVAEGVARITLFDASPTAMWSYAGDKRVSVLISTRDRRPIPERLGLTLSPYRVNSASPLAGVKSCNYLENIIAGEDARGRGFDEAVRPNERGEVAGGTMSNIFWMKDGMLHTPPLTTGCLPGTTREYILEKLECRESVIAIDELRIAEAIFLTSAGLGVVQVRRFDDITYETTSHPIVSILK